MGTGAAARADYEREGWENARDDPHAHLRGKRFPVTVRRREGACSVCVGPFPGGYWMLACCIARSSRRGERAMRGEDPPMAQVQGSFSCRRPFSEYARELTYSTTRVRLEWQQSPGVQSIAILTHITSMRRKTREQTSRPRSLNSLTMRSPPPPQDPVSGLTFTVDVLVALRAPETLEITVADAGEGIPRAELERGIFILGRKPSARAGPFSSLNEHGMGLKNALPWLTRTSGREFDLRTSWAPPSGPPEYRRVTGPLEVHGMGWQPSNVAEWNAWVNPRGSNKRTGTRIRFRCSKAQAFSGWEESFGIESKTMTFEDFAGLLDEHLGATYRHPLSSTTPSGRPNSLRTTYWNSPGYGKFWKRSEIRPIPIPFATGMSRRSVSR